MISSTIASALATSTPSQPQDSGSSASAVAEDANDAVSFSSAMANANAAAPTNDTSNREGGDCPGQTPVDGITNSSSANAATADQSLSGPKTAGTKTTARTAATSRTSLPTEQSAASAPAAKTPDVAALPGRAAAWDAATGGNSQKNAKADADKPASGPESAKAGTPAPGDTNTPAYVNASASADASGGAFVQGAVAQTMGAGLNAPDAGDRAPLLPGGAPSVAEFRPSERTDAGSAAQAALAQGDSPAVSSSAVVSNTAEPATSAVSSFATLLAARPEKAQGVPSDGNTQSTLGNSVPANASTAFAVSSPTAALASLVGMPNHVGAAPGLGSADINIATRVGDPGFGQDISQQLVYLAKTGAQSAQLNLQPAELGPVSVSIQMNGLQASLVISAGHAETRAALQEALPHLSELFQSSGLQLADAQVGDGSTRNAQQDASQRHALAVNDPLASTPAAHQTTIAVSTAAGSGLAGSRLIDTFA